MLVLVAAAAVAAHAEKQLVDRIVAVVEDEAIFASDIDIMVKQFMMQQGQSNLSPDDVKQLQNKFLRALINDKLVIAQAGRLNVEVTFSEVEEQVNKAIEENKKLLGGEEAFMNQLEQEGLTMEALKKLYRDQVHNRMLVERVLQMEINRNRPETSEDELRKFYEESRDQIPTRPAVAHLQTIFIGYETSTNARRAAKQKIDAVNERVLAGEAFEKLAREFSDDPSKSAGGDLGFLKPEDLRDPTFAGTAARLDVGEVSEPVLTSYGYHLIRVTEKNADTGELRISHILARIEPTDDDVREVLESANAIHAELMAGAPFDSLAKRYNTDPAADAFGDLGWHKIEELPQFFQDVLAGLTAGGVSQVLRDSAGFRIVKLVERENERPYEYVEIVGELRRLHQQERMNTMYEEYIEGLREKFTVDIKI
jgi:peptidyl-prolyl cis-trans isomerase SurA